MGGLDFFKTVIVLFLSLSTGTLFGQVIQSGEIVFERRTNLEKRYEGTTQYGFRSSKWLKEPKIDEFILYFDENSSLFKPIPPTLEDEDREWATMKNSTYQDLENQTLEREFSFYGTSVYLSDTLQHRNWIITDNRRNIAGFETKQALWVANDSTRIYAWYSEQIIPSVGPESFNGLPGTILGLAIEDGGVVYFAKEVKTLSKKDFKKEMPKGKSKNIYTREKLYEFISEKNITGRAKDDFFVW